MNPLPAGSARLRFVLTGGPGVGKTTLLEHLRSLGYSTVREAARDVIGEQMKLGTDVLPWKDQPAFQRRVLKVQLEREESATGPLIFADRGVPDGIAYLRASGLGVLRELLENARDRYEGVFLVEPLEGGYRPDPERREGPEAAHELHDAVETTYLDLGYQIVRVPPMPVAQRSAFVIERALGKL